MNQHRLLPTRKELQDLLEDLGSDGDGGVDGVRDDGNHRIGANLANDRCSD